MALTFLYSCFIHQPFLALTIQYYFMFKMDIFLGGTREEHLFLDKDALPSTKDL